MHKLLKNLKPNFTLINQVATREAVRITASHEGARSSTRMTRGHVGQRSRAWLLMPRRRTESNIRQLVSCVTVCATPAAGSRAVGARVRRERWVSSAIWRRCRGLGQALSASLPFQPPRSTFRACPFFEQGLGSTRWNAGVENVWGDPLQEPDECTGEKFGCTQPCTAGGRNAG